MAALSATLTHFSTTADSRTWTTSGHTASKPKLVIQKRKVPVGNAKVAETSIAVIQAAIGADDAILPSKVDAMISFRYSTEIKSGETTVADSLALIRDVVASDEFAALVLSQNFIKP